MTLTGGELVAKSLAARGVDRIYGLHGGHVQRIFDKLPEYDIELISTRDERAAAHMAHAHYQITGEPGVAIATAGPGITNAVTGIANAESYEVPMVLIGGSHSIKQAERGALQEMDQEGLYDPITKWSGTVLETERIPEYVDLAFRKAEQPRPGPAFLNIPMDVQNNTVPSRYLENGVTEIYSPHDTGLDTYADPEAVDEAVTLLREAERPIMISGVGAFNAGVTQEDMITFLEATQLPYLDTGPSRGLVPGHHPLNMNAARSKTIGEADTVFLFGKQLDFTVAYGSDVFFNEDTTFVQIDADPGEIGRNRPIDLPITGDEANVLSQLQGKVDAGFTPRWEDWVADLREKDNSSREKLTEKMDVEGDPIHPWQLCAELRQRVEEDAYVGCDGGDILSFGRIALGVDKPGHWLNPGPFGCIGSTVPFAIAAAMLRPDSQVVCLIGDGSFGFNAMELETAARYDADVTFMVANNAAWNIDRIDQKRSYDNVVGTDLIRMEYHRLAEAVGGKGEHVESVDALGPALDRAIEFEGPSVVNVVVDQDQASPDRKQGMLAHENLDRPDLQLLRWWDEKERAKREE